MRLAHKKSGIGHEFEELLVDALRSAGWQVLRKSKMDWGADLVAERDGKKYILELKNSSESRPDRLIPLLSQAILQVQAAARNFPEPAIPVAVVATNYIPQSAAKRAEEFARRYGPDVGFGIMDREGLRLFHGDALDELNAEHARPHQHDFWNKRSAPQLFSDLNQWMMKILLSENISQSLLSAPRERYQNASQLAQAANVSMMSAFRFIEQLSEEGFLEDRRGFLQVVRIEALFERWRAASQRGVRDIPARWIIPSKADKVRSALAAYYKLFVSERPDGYPENKLRSSFSRACLGLFAAADALGLGFVHGVPPYLYLERVDSEVLGQLGLSVNDAGRATDLYLRIPRNRESIFRASVDRDDIPVSDIFQVWLDASNHPARGREQADFIWRKVLSPALEKRLA